MLQHSLKQCLPGAPEGPHPGDLLCLRQDQDDRHAHEPCLPAPVQMLRLH